MYGLVKFRQQRESFACPIAGRVAGPILHILCTAPYLCLDLCLPEWAANAGHYPPLTEYHNKAYGVWIATLSGRHERIFREQIVRIWTDKHIISLFLPPETLPLRFGWPLCRLSCRVLQAHSEFHRALSLVCYKMPPEIPDIQAL